MGLFPVLIFGIKAEADSLKKYHLHPVRVVAEGAQSSIGAVQSVLRPPNLETLSETVKNAPGISVTYGSRDESNLRIRGFRKNENLVLIDGRPLNSGYFGNVDISKILADNIAEIRIVKGPASALYGTSTMGGVVNIITQKEDHLVSLESRISRNLVNSQRLSSSRGFGGFRYKLSLMRDERRPFPLSQRFKPTVFENGKLRDHFYQESWHADLGLDFILADIHEIGFNAGFSRIPYKEIPSSLYSWDYGIYRDWYRANAGISFDYYSTVNSNLRGQLYFDAAGDTFERFRDPGHQQQELSSRMESINIGFAPAYELRNKGILTSGSRMELRKVKRKDNNNYQEWTGNHAFVGNVFSQYERPLGERYTLSASLGLAFFGHSKSEHTRLYPEPSVAISLEHNDGGSTMLSTGINSAVPTMRQLFSAENGNPSLKASSAWKSEISHKRSLSRYSIVDISLFYNDVKNLIDRQVDQYQNIYQVQTYGTEIALNGKLAKFWDSTLQYSWLECLGDYSLSDSAPHSVEFMNGIDLPKSWGASLGLIWKSDRKSQDGVGIFRDLPQYYVLNAGVSKEIRNLELNLEFSNILDSNYQSEYGYPAPGRDVSLRLKYTLR